MNILVRRLPSVLAISALAVWASGFPGGGLRVSAPAGLQATAVQTVETIEESLLILVNKERAARNLAPLSPSADLTRLARGQSREMADSGVLTHASKNGRTLSERLAGAAILYRGNGENVARSESSLPGDIHESFMKSPGHRENILHPDFDLAGIGVVRAKDGTYFITQDYIQSVTVVGEAEARSFLRGRLDAVRAANALPPVILEERAAAFAGSMARERALGSKVEAVPGALGRAKVVFTIGPDLEGIAVNLEREALIPLLPAGIGIWFGRTGEYPGGAYYVCTVFLPRDPHRGMTAAGLVETVLAAANVIRRGRNLAPLVPDHGLSKAAEGSVGRRRPARVPQGAWAVLYETPDLTSFPEAVRAKIEDGSYGRIGLAVVRRPEQGSAGIYEVAVFLVE